MCQRKYGTPPPDFPTTRICPVCRKQFRRRQFNGGRYESWNIFLSRLTCSNECTHIYMSLTPDDKDCQNCGIKLRMREREDITCFRVRRFCNIKCASEFKLNNWRGRTGIYCIANKKNGMMYIGSSIHINARLNAHRNRLYTATHSNNHIQHDWDTFGPNNFSFEILEEFKHKSITDTQLKQIEFGYLSCVPRFMLYNIVNVRNRSYVF